MDQLSGADRYARASDRPAVLPDCFAPGDHTNRNLVSHRDVLSCGDRDPADPSHRVSFTHCLQDRYNVVFRLDEESVRLH